MPVDRPGYQDDIDNIEEREYCYIDYAHAYISDIRLIRRCLEISKVPLWNLIKVLIRYHHNTRSNYTNFDMESCKLLYENGCDVTGLLHVACHMHDYNSIRYLVDNMSDVELYNLVHSREYIYLNLASLLLIDRLMNMRDRCFTSLLIDIVLKEDYQRHDNYWVIDNMNIYNSCYYIIKYMSIDDGKKFMKELNQLYDDRINGLTFNNNTERHIDEQLLHNNLLEYHFRPRGSHTKGAVQNS
jgi:hypothetical protein